MRVSDETILELQQALNAANVGDSEAFNSLLLRFELRFRTLVRKMLWQYPHVRRWEDTDDVYQSSMMRLHRSLSDARPESVRQFVGLAATQIRRTLIDLARHYFGSLGTGRNHHTDDQGRAADDPGGPVENSSSLNEPDSLEDWTAFHQATRNLPPEPREAFELVWYAGLQQNEAAALLNISRRTLIRRLNLARRMLAEQLSDPD